MRVSLATDVNVRQEQFGDLGGLLYKDELYELNQTGYIVFEYLNRTGGSSVDDLSNHLANKFDIDKADAQEDVVEFVQRMEKFGIVEVEHV